MTFRQFTLILLARWRSALGVFGALIVIALALAFLLPKKYTATASVVVDFKPAPDANTGIVEAQATAASYIATQVDIISSQAVAMMTARRLKLDQNPDYHDDWEDTTGGRGDIIVWIATERLKKEIEVTPSRDSQVIDIAVTERDPKFAAVVANAVAQAYIDTTIQLKVDAAKHYANWFEEQARQLRATLELKEKQLADYERQTGTVPAPTDGRLDIENARLADLSSKLVIIQGLRQDTQSRERQFSSGDYGSLPEVQQSPLIIALKEDLSRAEAKLQNIAANSGKNYPDYQTTSAEIASLRDRITQESAKIAESISTSNQINLKREAELQAAIAAQKTRMQELTHQTDVATGLQNDVIAARRDLDTVTQRLAQSSLEGATQRTNISVLTPAEEPVKKSSPKRLIILAVGLLLGILGGIFTALAREAKDRRVRVDDEIVDLLGVPLLAIIGRVAVDRGGPAEARVLPRLEPQTSQSI